MGDRPKDGSGERRNICHEAGGSLPGIWTASPLPCAAAKAPIFSRFLSGLDCRGPHLLWAGCRDTGYDQQQPSLCTPQSTGRLVASSATTVSRD